MCEWREEKVMDQMGDGKGKPRITVTRATPCANDPVTPSKRAGSPFTRMTVKREL